MTPKMTFKTKSDFRGSSGVDQNYYQIFTFYISALLCVRHKLMTNNIDVSNTALTGFSAIFFSIGGKMSERKYKRITPVKTRHKCMSICYIEHTIWHFIFMALTQLFQMSSQMTCGMWIIICSLQEALISYSI